MAILNLWRDSAKENLQTERIIFARSVCGAEKRMPEVEKRLETEENCLSAGFWMQIIISGQERKPWRPVSMENTEGLSLIMGN